MTGGRFRSRGYRYRFQVVDSDDINAFAVPTGYIFMTRGLLESLESDNEVAAILAHEIAHVESPAQLPHLAKRATGIDRCRDRGPLRRGHRQQR